MSECSVLKDVGNYKNELVGVFTSSDNICELLFNKKSYTPTQADGLLYNQIFPYLYVDETQTDVKSYICWEVDVPRVPTGTVKDMKLIIWAYCHKECMEYSKKGYAGTRVDILSDMIESQLRDSDKFGIGKLHLESATYFFPSKIHYGRQLIFTIPDFKIGKR